METQSFDLLRPGVSVHGTELSDAIKRRTAPPWQLLASPRCRDAANSFAKQPRNEPVCVTDHRHERHSGRGKVPAIFQRCAAPDHSRPNTSRRDLLHARAGTRLPRSCHPHRGADTPLRGGRRRHSALFNRTRGKRCRVTRAVVVLLLFDHVQTCTSMR